MNAAQFPGIIIREFWSKRTTLRRFFSEGYMVPTSTLAPCGSPSVSASLRLASGAKQKAYRLTILLPSLYHDFAKGPPGVQQFNTSGNHRATRVPRLANPVAPERGPHSVFAELD